MHGVPFFFMVSLQIGMPSIAEKSDRPVYLDFLRPLRNSVAPINLHM